MCARHIFSNWRKVHKGLELERAFWRCVKATSPGEFEIETAKLKEISQAAYDDFMSKDPSTFCKSQIKTTPCCDVVDNNMAETFNSFILLARYKPIISMLEDIRLALMERMKRKKAIGGKFVAGIAPRVSQKLKEAYNEQKYCECHWNGQDSQTGFEVSHNGVSHAVDLEKHTCSCRSWDLTGIPCSHGMSAILFMNKAPEDFVAKWYLKDNYEKCYSNMLQPVPGHVFWNHEGENMVLPPDIVRKKPGRRKIARRKDADEPSKKGYSRRGLPTHCSTCGGTDHNKRKCTVTPTAKETPNQTARAEGSKRGRPKGSSSRYGKTVEQMRAENMPNAAEFVARYRKHTRRQQNTTQQEGRTWLQSVADNSAAAGRGRGNRSGGTRRRVTPAGRGRGGGRTTVPTGIGLWRGEGGEAILNPNFTGPGINMRDSQEASSSAPETQ